MRGVWQDGVQDFGGTQGRWGGWSINKEDERGWEVGVVGTGHITGPGIAGYNVVFDFDSKGRAGKCYGSLQEKKVMIRYIFQEALSGCWVENGF